MAESTQEAPSRIVVMANGKAAKASPKPKPNPHAPWRIGENYFIRTVTHHYTGQLVAVYPGELVITSAAWIADNGRFAQAMATGSFNEIEPYPDGDEVIIGRGSIVDAKVIAFALPRTQK